MKVLHIIDSGGFYGAEVMLLNLCVEQIKQGLDVEVLSIGTINSPPKALELKLQDASVPCKPWHMHPIPDFRQSFKILAYCKSVKVDIIHSHGYKGNILLGIIPKKLRALPIITTVHGYTRQSRFSKLTMYQWLDRLCLRRLDAVVLVSKSILEQISSKGLQPSIYVINNGIPEKADVKGTYKSLFNEAQFKLGALGRLSYEKNFSALIDAMATVTKQKPNVKLVIYGEGEERATLEKKIKELQLDAIVALPGYLEDTLSFLIEIDLFINSSITEGMPISLLEAMRAETNIMATKIPANVELVGDSKYVPQICDVNAIAIAKAIIGFCNEAPDEIKKQRTFNKDLFLKDYTIEIMTKNYTNLYKTLI
jgi:glycosyltransferase involved in cell wall biosynthesis